VTEGAGRAALEQTRASRAAMRRRVLPLWLAGVATVAYLMARKAPYVGLHGRSLVLSVALCGFVVGITGARHAVMVSRGPARVYMPFVLLLLLSSAVLVWLQPHGLGVLGFLGAGVLFLFGGVVHGRVRILVACVCCVAVLTTAALTAKQPDQSRWESFAASVLPFLAYLLLASVFVWHRQQQEKTERLLLELDQTRGAELRAAALAERQRLARDMHDVLAHTLSGLTVQLQGARLLALSAGDERLASVIDRAHELAKSGLAEARQAIGTLRGDKLPGPDRLAGLADEFAAGTGIPCRFSTSGEQFQVRPEAGLAMYRVTQEALTNVRKHAHADRVEVALDYLPDEVRVTVRDFGTAPAPEVSVPDRAGSGGYGLTGMRERAELLGGTLTAGPAEDGFLVELRIPSEQGDRT
jgi:signal transduction histidine kinase